MGGKAVFLDTNVVATALVHGVPRLLTANVAEFQRFAGSPEIVELEAGGPPVTAETAELSPDAAR